jgi:hypothetical protein
MAKAVENRLGTTTEALSTGLALVDDLVYSRQPAQAFGPHEFLNLLVLIRPPLTYQYEQLYTTKFSKFIQDARTSTSRCSVLEYQLVNTKFSFAHGYSWCKYLLPRV